MVVAGSADVGVEDRDGMGWRPVRGLAIELVVEDGAHRAVGQRADLNGARGRRFETLGAERPHQANDTETGAEALFGVGPALQDQLAQGGRGGTDRRRLVANALALKKDLAGARRQPHLALAAGEAVGDAVEVSLALDVVIDADPPQPP